MAQIVYQEGGPPIPFGSIDAGEPGVFPMYEGVDPANLGAHEGKAMLIVAAPLNAASSTVTPGPIPFGSAESTTQGHAFDVIGLFPVIYPAATQGRSTSPSDTPASTYVPGKFTGDVQSQISLFGGANPGQAGGAAFGELVLTDLDGELDAMLELGWDGAAIELRRGEPDSDFSTFSTVAKFTSAGMVGDVREKRLRLRPLGWLLEAAELHGQRYGGTGGLDGDATLAGRLKPYAVGYSFNISPVLIAATPLCFQVSFSSISQVSAVRDGGAALAFSANYATYDLLVAATVPAGQYATCLAYGLIRLGSLPVYGITADVCGDNDTINSVAGPTTRAGVVRRIATALGAVRLSDTDQIDSAAFIAFGNVQSAPVGWYWDGSDAITKKQALDEVLAGCMGWWLVRPNGQLTIGQIEAPEARSANFSLDYAGTGASESRLGEPSIADTLAPRRATFVGYKWNYTQQSQDQLAASVSQADALIYSQPTRYGSFADLFTSNSYPTSPAVYVNGGFRDGADAANEAERQARVFAAIRRRYAVPIVMDPLADIVGQRVQINNLSRFGWGTAKTLLVCGLETAGGSVVAHLWG